MNEFRRTGLIRYDSQIEIHTTSLLNVVFHEEPQINRLAPSASLADVRFRSNTDITACELLSAVTPKADLAGLSRMSAYVLTCDFTFPKIVCRNFKATSRTLLAAPPPKVRAQ